MYMYSSISNDLYNCIYTYMYVQNTMYTYTKQISRIRIIIIYLFISVRTFWSTRRALAAKCCEGQARQFVQINEAPPSGDVHQSLSLSEDKIEFLSLSSICIFNTHLLIRLYVFVMLATIYKNPRMG